MLSRIEILSHAVVLAVLVAFVLIFTDRSIFAWTLAGACFVGVLAGDLLIRAVRARTRR
ncbi:hypothetical protein GL325_08075 [Aeromicrobium sp. 636]|uniref:Uncharacterized protein n=1 Tax=Aeromicrobium senzhongii TaxID=2663859 RepID=A0A8I0EVT1_9ACTN|nr:MULTISPECIES: hypothetical protein [Aeromicrobium]MBC9226273.1 hypothetical protein [Aeromicrobium senzhongii]MCQ3998379.1 hypothetical protein [Aeromicrobium sp. 636]